MKKLTLTVMSMCYLFSFAQPNNPYHKTGIEFIQSLKLINEDINRGKINDFSQETIDNYQNKLPLHTKIEANLAAEIVKVGQTNRFEPTAAIRNSTFSSGAKEILSTMLESQLTLDDANFLKYLHELTNTVLRSPISSNEREAILRFIAIQFHLTQHPDLQERRGTCEVETPFGTLKFSKKECRKYYAYEGFVKGYQYCGFLCGLGGALVGTLVGSSS